MPSSRKLTLLEEEVMLERVLDLDDQESSPRIVDIGDMASLLLEKRDGGIVGKRWGQNFITMRHHPFMLSCLSS